VREWFNAIGKGITSAFEDYKAARRLLLFWACWLITYTVLKFFNNLGIIEAHHIAFFVAVIGILMTVVVFYQWHRGKDGDAG